MTLLDSIFSFTVVSLNSGPLSRPNNFQFDLISDKFATTYREAIMYDVGYGLSCVRFNLLTNVLDTRDRDIVSK